MRSAIAVLFCFCLASASFAAMPHIEAVAPGVWAAGFADKFGSANCGWAVLGDQTVLIGLPRGATVDELLAEVQRTAGKPVRAVVLTHGDADSTYLAELARRGVRLVTANQPGLERIDYGNATNPPGAAVWLSARKVLFAGPAVVHGPRARIAGSNTGRWLATLDRLDKLGATVVVPGYGTWGKAPSLLDRQRRFLTELRRQVAYGITMGRPLADITRDFLLPASYYAWMPYDTPRNDDLAHVYREFTAPNAPFSGPPPGPGGPPQALVLIGDRYHEPEHLEAGLRPAFAATGVTPHFTVDVTTLNADTLRRVQLLVILRDGMLWPEGPAKPYKIWMTPAQEKAVVDFVEGGGAFLNLHNSMGLYPENGPYLNLVGGRYIGHGPLERFRVEVVDSNHPITAGVTAFTTADEQHTPPHDAKVHELLRNRSDEGKTAPAGWAYEPGRGRLVHLAPGHTRDALEHPMFQRLMRNAVNWLLRR